MPALVSVLERRFAVGILQIDLARRGDPQHGAQDGRAAGAGGKMQDPAPPPVTGVHGVPEPEHGPEETASRSLACTAALILADSDSSHGGLPVRAEFARSS